MVLVVVLQTYPKDGLCRRAVGLLLAQHRPGDARILVGDGEASGLVKVLTVPGKDKILGVTIAGEHAGDLIAEYVAAMRHGLGLNKILSTIHIYPTLAEANKYVAGEWRRAHAPQRLLGWLERWHDWRRGRGVGPLTEQTETR
jgi:hypothetical protein